MGIAYMFNTVTSSAYEQLPSTLLTVKWLKVLYKSHTKLQITCYVQCMYDSLK